MVTVLPAQSLDPSTLNAGAVALEQEGRYLAAETEFLKALRLCELSPNQTPCENLAGILNNLGSLYYLMGRYRDAEPSLARAVVQSPGNAAAITNLAAVYRAQARYAEAAPLYQRAQELRERVAGDPLLPGLLNNVAQFWLDTADYSRAEQSVRRALSLLAAAGLEESAEGATCLATLAGVLQSQGKPEESKPFLLHSLEIRGRLFGPAHPTVADTRNSLALTYRLQGKFAEAEQQYRLALSIFRSTQASSSLAATLNNLGRVLAEQRKWKEAESLYREAIARWEELFGRVHPNVAAGLTNLATLLQSRRRHREAALLLDRARVIDESSFPADHPRIAFDLNNAAALASARKHYPEAEELFLKAAAILEHRLPADHPEIGQVLANLAAVYGSEKKLEESERTYRRALAILNQAWGSDDARLMDWLQRYALVLRARQEYAEAAKVDLQAMRIRVVRTLR